MYTDQHILAPDLNGYVYAEIGSSPNGVESLWVGTCNTTSCGIEVTRDEAKAVFSNGVAIFQVLFDYYSDPSSSSIFFSSFSQSS